MKTFKVFGVIAVAASVFATTGCSTCKKEDFVSSYSVQEGCGSSNANFTSTITQSSVDNSTVLISNFADVFVNPVEGTVSACDVTIPQQEPDNDDYLVSGSGSLSGNVLTLSYTVTNNLGQEVDCTATFTKQ